MHKPQLAILASTPDTAQRLYCQYQEIFDGYLDIQYYSFQNVPAKAPLAADLVLITTRPFKIRPCSTWARTPAS